MKNYSHKGAVLSLPAPYNLQSGAAFMVGTIFAVAVSDAVAGAEVEAKMRGVYLLPKNASQAWTAGARIYWDSANKRCDTASAAGPLVGAAVYAVAASASTGAICLGGVIGGAGAAGTAPAITNAAAITGTPQQGIPLAITSATFSGSPTPTITRVIRMDGTQVASGDGSTGYTPVLADVGKIPSVTDTGNNGVGSPATSTGAGSAVIAASGGAVAPAFTAAPTFNMTPTSGAVLSVVSGAYTGTAQSQTKTIYKDGIDVGDNYQVTQRDLQAQFQGVHTLNNAAGTVAAGTAIASGIQDTTLAPAFTTAGGIGLPANPYLMSVEVAAGFEVKMYTGTRTTDVTTVTTGFEIASSLAGPWAADASGTTRTAPFRGYKTVAGQSGKFIRGWIDLAGTGTNPQARYYTDAIPIVAPGTRSGEVVTVSSVNRLALKGTARPNKVTKSVTTYTHTVGSAPIDSIVLDLCNIISDGQFTTSGSGFVRTFEAIDIVYQGQVYQPRFGGVIPSNASPLVVSDGATEIRSDPVSTTTAFGASWPVVVPGEDILVRFREVYVPNQIVPLTEGNDNLQWTAATTFYDPATDTIVNDVGNTNAGNNYRTSVTGAGVANTGIGPSIMLLGTFAAKDAVTVFGAGDSRRAAQGTVGLHAPAYNRNICKPPIANINCAYSGGNVYFMSSNGLIQKYFKLCDTLVDGFGINTMQDVANAGNATSLISECKTFWALFKANASVGANRRPARVFRTSLQFRFQTSGTVTGGDGSVVSYSNTFQHLQPCYPKMDLGGDIQLYWVTAMLAEVQSGNLAGYIEYRDRIALSRDPAQPGYYRTLPGRYGDGLHGGDGRVAAKLEYQMVVG